MYDRIGVKLMVMAKAFFWIGAVGSIIGGLSVITQSPLTGILTIVVGCLVSWLSTLALYGLGYLIVLTESIGAFMNRQAAEPAPKTILSNTPKMGPAKACPHCGEQVRSNVCGMCGQTNNLFDR